MKRIYLIILVLCSTYFYGGKVELIELEKLGGGGFQIVFATDDIWFTSSGYIITQWIKNIPRRQFHLNAYNYLDIDSGGFFISGDKICLNLKNKKNMEFPKLQFINKKTHYGLEVDKFYIFKKKKVAILIFNWRPPRGYQYAYPNKFNPEANFWYLVDLKTGRAIYRQKKKRYRDPFVTYANTKFVITNATDNDGIIQIFDYNGKLIKSFNTQKQTYLNQVYFSKDQNLVLSADNIGTIFVTDLRKEQIKAVEYFKHSVASLALTSDNKNIIAGDIKGNLVVLGGVDFKKTLYKTKIDGNVRKLKFNPSRDKLYLLSSNSNNGNSITIYQLTKSN